MASKVLALGCFGLLACTVAVSNPDTGFPGNYQQPQDSGEQAESDLVVATDQNSGAPVLVSCFRDTGPSPLPQGSNDIEYQPGSVSAPSDVALFHRGASFGGFAYSVDEGRSWVAPAKVRPPLHEFPILWGDARLSVDRLHPWRVAMINLAASDDVFRAAQGYDSSTDTIQRFPNSQSELTVPPLCSLDLAAGRGCDSISSVCVTVSQNAGRAFPTPACFAIRRCSDSNSACTTNADCGGAQMHASPDRSAKRGVRGRRYALRRVVGTR